MGDIQTTNLGNSDIEITPIGMGAWQFAEGKSFSGWFWDSLTPEVTNSIIKEALDQGINWFDTAEAYGGGKSERGLASGLQEHHIEDNEVRIATKWWPFFRLAGNIPKTIHTRMEKLDPYSIDLYQIHQPWSFSFTKTEMEKMAEIADQGYIKSIGVSNFSSGKMRSAFEHLEEYGYPLVSNQVKYSLLDRSIENNGILETANELGITIIAYSPLEQGLLTAKFHEKPESLNNRPFLRRRMLKRKLDTSRGLVEVIQMIAEETDSTPSQVSLNWLINYFDNVVAIPGASKPEHVEQNGGAMRVELSREQMNTIEEKSQKFL